jgi:hypothetical protein
MNTMISVETFVEKCVAQDRDPATYDELYPLYSGWCASSGYAPLSKAQFVVQMRLDLQGSDSIQ